MNSPDNRRKRPVSVAAELPLQIWTADELAVHAETLRSLVLRDLRWATIADDVAQDVFVKLLKVLGENRPIPPKVERGGLRAYVRMMGRHMFLDGRKRMRRAENRLKLMPPPTRRPLAELVGKQRAEEAGLQTRQRPRVSKKEAPREVHLYPDPLTEEGVDEAISRLPHRLQQVIELYLKDLTTKEIATELGKKESTVRSYMKEAIDSMRDWLRPDSDEEARHG